jgi:GNAT superfamily N-acetyltransferase
MNESVNMATRITRVFELDKSKTDQAIELLVSAFEHDPGYRYLCGRTGDEYRRRLGVTFRSGRAMQRASGQPVLGISDGDQLGGVAIFQEPGTRFPVWAQARWLLTIALVAGPGVARRSLANMQVSEKAHPREPHFYLPILAVHPDFHGRGYGRTLLEAVHLRSQRNSGSRGVCLETENPNNVPFYEHLGYRVIAQSPLAHLEITTLFRRDEPAP